MDDDFEDLLGDGGSEPGVSVAGDVREPTVGFGGPDTAQDDMGEESVSKPKGGFPDRMPSENELVLGRRVLELEKERDSMQAELQALRARYPQHTMVPVPDTTSQPAELITIPQELLPTLALLRNHIAELTRDNEALRYTFLGRSAVAQSEPSSSKITPDALPIPEATMRPAMSAVLAPQIPDGVQGLDLSVVVERVKQLVRENEELGEMVLEAGREGKEEWQQALDESKAVITSLDSDLEHHLSVVQSLRAELVAYKTHFGPLPPNGSPSPITSRSSRTAPSALTTTSRDRDRDRDRGPGGRGFGRERDREREQDGSDRGQKYDGDQPSRREPKKPVVYGSAQPRGSDRQDERRRDNRRDYARNGAHGHGAGQQTNEQGHGDGQDRDIKRRR